MTRSTVWVFVVVVGTARLSQAVQLPELKPLPKGDQPAPKKSDLPAPKVVAPPPKPLPPAEKTVEKPAPSPKPILFPAPPYPPPAPAVVDPRTGAWEQVQDPAQAGLIATCEPVEVSGPVHHAPVPRGRLLMNRWLYRFNRSGEVGGCCEVASDATGSEWHAVEARPAK